MKRDECRPTISVIVPSFNKPEYLPECLRSIQEQTFTDWECIVVSDGSPRVEEIRAAVEGMKDPRFRLVEHKENRGLAAARNTGIREAKAELVICVDEDDRIAPNCLVTLHQQMNDGDAEVVCPQGRFFGGARGVRGCHRPTVEEILTGQPLLPAGSLIRRGVFRKVGLYDEHPMIHKGREDHEWWIRVISGEVRLRVCDEELYFVRRPDTVADYEESLDFGATKHEFSIYRYITGKHAGLYSQYPDARRAVLRKALLREAARLEWEGRRIQKLVRLWRAVMLFREARDAKRAMRETLDLILGRVRVEQILAWRRRLNGDPGLG